jgi:hypothetical protein
MGRDVMDDRKRALVLGKFKFLYQVNANFCLDNFVSDLNILVVKGIV